MKSILQIRDPILIKDLLAQENIYSSVAYDDSPSLNDLDVSAGVWLILLQDQHAAGLIKLEYLNNVLWTPHIFIYKQFRGKGSEEWGKQAAQYMREVHGAEKFLAFTPYQSAKKYAERMGFKYLATLTKSIKKNGELLDQYILEK